MSSVGSSLRELRTQRGVSLEEMARATRVAHRYIEALEADDFAVLPAPVFTKGFIRAYCQVLGMPADEALERYALLEGATMNSAAPSVHRKLRPIDAERRERGAILVSFVFLVVLGVALFMYALARQSTREESSDRGAPTAPPQSPSDRAPAVASNPALGVGERTSGTPGPVSSEASATREPEPTVATVSTRYRLVARTTETTWIRVRTEEGRTTEETIPAGEVRAWVSNRPFIVTVGNAGGVTFELNGRTLPPLGARGAVVRQLVLPSDGQ